jgi:hypothetical protein
MTARILDALDVVSPTTRRDVILALPEVVATSQHKALLPPLQRLLQEDSDLMAAALDSLTSLSLDAAAMV